MVFSSLIFLYAFFSLSLLAFSFCKTRNAQNTVLLIFSLIFYAWGEPKYVLLLMFMALNAWFCALRVEKAENPGAKKIWVLISSAVDIALIGWFKYAGLVSSLFGPVPEFIAKIALPIGISFYTFQLLTYVVDVYRGEAPVQKNYFNVLLYASLFHQCIAGPIVRYGDVARELFGPESRKPEVAVGVSRFCAGLAKKALLRPVDERHPSPFYAELEEELLARINRLGIGPQGFGGKTTALAVSILSCPTHIAGLPVAVNINCHVTRHKTEVL